MAGPLEGRAIDKGGSIDVRFNRPPEVGETCTITLEGTEVRFKVEITKVGAPFHKEVRGRGRIDSYNRPGSVDWKVLPS